jgi:hypothetical protein
MKNANGFTGLNKKVSYTLRILFCVIWVSLMILAHFFPQYVKVKVDYWYYIALTMMGIFEYCAVYLITQTPEEKEYEFNHRFDKHSGDDYGDR